jgi:delta-aminolevulinic acid dehydratase/porphobilinogen synthase
MDAFLTDRETAPLTIRPRRLRRTASLRRLVRETRLDPAQLVLPVFVRTGANIRLPVRARRPSRASAE